VSTAVLYDVPGPKARRRSQLLSVAGAVVLALLAVLVVQRLASRDQFEGERWAVLKDPDVRQLLVDGLVGTLKAAATAMVLSLVVGILLAVGRLSETAWIRIPVRVWVELFRGLPLLLVIFFLFLGGPSVGADVSVFWALVVGLTLYNSAVIAEIVRAGVLSLPRGQREGALAIGLRPVQAMRYVLLPQALRVMLPAMISQVVVLLKDTSLGFVIGYLELLRAGRNVVEFLGSSYSLPIYLTVALVFIVVNLALSSLAKAIDRRQGRSGKAPTTVRPGQPAGVALADEA
jgi:glutamate transport system permease protein